MNTNPLEIRHVIIVMPALKKLGNLGLHYYNIIYDPATKKVWKTRVEMLKDDANINANYYPTYTMFLVNDLSYLCIKRKRHCI